MLPNKRRVGSAWQPALPLILSAWHETSALLKIMRLEEHIDWADQHGALDVINDFLRSLPESDWAHFTELA
jgi:hypothetical protein